MDGNPDVGVPGQDDDRAGRIGEVAIERLLGAKEHEMHHGDQPMLIEVS